MVNEEERSVRLLPPTSLRCLSSQHASVVLTSGGTVLPAYLYSLLHLYYLRVVFIHARSICVNFIKKGLFWHCRNCRTPTRVQLMFDIVNVANR